MRRSIVCVLMLFCALHLFPSCNDGIVRTWNLSQIKTEEVPGGRPKFISGPMFMTWEASDDAVLGFFKVTGLPSMVVPMGSAKIAQQLKDITFQKDGNVVATYAVPSEDAQAEPKWEKSKPGMVTYKVKGDQILFFPNIDDLMASIPADSLKNNATLNEAVEMLKSGIPVNYTISGNTAKLFIDKAFIEKIFPLVIAGLDNVDPASMGNMGGMIKGLLQGIPAVLQKTTKLEIGLNLEK